ncbi:MAG: O-antigen ligase family protein [Rhodococcus sp. (in: high G+C Gram-positive bacteria)]|uniref:O-antigen ligase family protein n=1 Tax=Rhodococcus sp. TaxID=1831 RepID=UPI002AD83581|nr:O-antigen ligase family protein [Rhodococcus sp. (in: high G+C Gram-positive bacteria)]
MTIREHVRLDDWQFYILSGVIALGVSVIAFRLLTPGGLNYPLAFVYLCMLFAFANLKFDIVMSTIVLAAMWTGFQLPVAGINTRLDTLLMPAGILSALLNGYGPQIKKSLREPVVLLLIAFIGVNALSSVVFAVDPGDSLRIVIWYGSNLVILVLALACWANSRERLYRLLFVGAVVNVFAGLLGWFNIASGGTWGGYTDGIYGARTSGIAFEANILAGICAIWLLIAITSTKKLHWFVWATILVGAGVTIMTNTRAAVIAVVVGVLLYFVFRGRKSLRILPVLIAVSAGAYAVKLFDPDTYEQIVGKLSNVQFDNDTAVYRYNVWDIASTEPQGWSILLGMGTNSYGQRHLDPTDLTNTKAAYIGNLPLQTYYDVGIAGVAILAVAVFLVWRRGSPYSRQRRLAILAGFLIISTACSPFFFAYFWLLIALSLAKDSRPTVSVRPPTAPVDRNSHEAAVVGRQ